MQRYESNSKSLNGMAVDCFFNNFNQFHDEDKQLDNSTIVVGYQHNRPQRDMHCIWKSTWQNIKKQINTIYKTIKRIIEWHRSIFYLYDSFGKRRKCHSICTIDSMSMKDGNSKVYLVYADGTKDNMGNINLFVAIIDSKASKNSCLVPIVDPDEKYRVERLVADIKDSINDQLISLPF